MQQRKRRPLSLRRQRQQQLLLRPLSTLPPLAAAARRWPARVALKASPRQQWPRSRSPSVRRWQRQRQRQGLVRCAQGAPPSRPRRAQPPSPSGPQHAQQRQQQQHSSRASGGPQHLLRGRPSRPSRPRRQLHPCRRCSLVAAAAPCGSLQPAALPCCPTWPCPKQHCRPARPQQAQQARCLPHQQTALLSPASRRLCRSAAQPSRWAGLRQGSSGRPLQCVLPTVRGVNPHVQATNQRLLPPLSLLTSWHMVCTAVRCRCPSWCCRPPRPGCCCTPGSAASGPPSKRW